jgi:hypothetical protein
MKPVSLKKNNPDNSPMFMGMSELPKTAEFPSLWLDDLKGVEIPEEGEIRLRFSRISKTETEDQKGERMSVQLKLKAITDICDCKGRDAENNEEEIGSEEMDAEDAMESLMEDLDLSEVEDESEDDNPEKY